jgi:hypothetical protein
MADVDAIFRDFARAFEGDRSTDPRPYLEQVDAVDREELRLRIEAFLERVPRREWDPDAFAGSLAERALAAASPEIDAPAVEDAKGWSELLPALRDAARLKRAEVVEKLASALGFPQSEEKVAMYVHQMEMGALPAKGVSTRVLEALGSILGASAETLRRVGEAGEAGGASGGEVFARRGAPSEGMASPGVESHDLAYESVADASSRESRDLDELDRLFTGGD